MRKQKLLYLAPIVVAAAIFMAGFQVENNFRRPDVNAGGLIYQTPRRGLENQPKEQSPSTEEEMLTLPGDPELEESKLIREAEFLFSRGDFKRAHERLRKVTRNNPNNNYAFSLMVAAKTKYQNVSDSGMLEHAEYYAQRSDFIAAVKTYQAYLDKHPESELVVTPLIVRCYYNLGLQALKNYESENAQLYFRQILFIDPTHELSLNALKLLKSCPTKEECDLEERKSIAFLELM